MALNKTKWITLLLAIFFAILQVLQPFIHAHLDENHSPHEAGFHVGAEHEEYFDSHSNKITDYPHAAHIVTVSSAIKQDIDSALLFDLLPLFVLCLSFFILLRPTLVVYPQLSLLSYQRLRKRLPATRAPPR